MTWMKLVAKVTLDMVKEDSDKLILEKAFDILKLEEKMTKKLFFS